MDMRRDWGTGSLYQRSDGRWLYSIELPGPPRRRRTISGKSKAEVRKRIPAWLASMPSLTETSPLVSAVATDWLAAIHRTRRDRTLDGYAAIVRLGITPGLGTIALDELTPGLVAAWRDDLLERLSPRTVSHYLACLRTLLTWAEQHDLASRNVAALVAGPAIDATEVRPLDAAQVRTFLRALTNEPLRSLYVVAVTTGMRQGELIGLRWQDVDWTRREVTVNQTMQRLKGVYSAKPPKTPRSRRTIPLTDTAYRLLSEHRAAMLARPPDARRKDQGLVWSREYGAPLDATWLGRDFGRLIAAAGLPRQRFHDLRHAAASMMLAQGMPMRAIADMLGHSTPSVTANTYAHLGSDTLRVAAERMEEAIG